jgi:hypothetical protein
VESRADLRLVIVRLHLFVAALTSALASPSFAQSRTDCFMTGRVLDSRGTPVVHANVTFLQGAVITVASSDSAGSFRLRADSASGTLLVRAIGFASSESHVDAGLRRCVPIRIVLTPATTRLAPVHVNARRETPPARNQPRIGTAWVEHASRAGRVGADHAGELDQLLANTPGVVGASGGAAGFSVLGLSPEQSITTLNGARVEAVALPPESGVLPRVATSPFDVSRGGFSGGELSLLSAPAGGLHVRHLSAGVGAIAGSPDAARGSVESVVTVGGALEGVLPKDIAGYRLSWRAAEQPSPSLPFARSAHAQLGDPTLIDSLDAALAAARAKGVVSDGSLINRRGSRGGSVMLRADGLRWQRSSPFLSVLGNWERTAGLGAVGLSAPSHTGNSASDLLVVQAGLNTTFASGPLNELTLTGARQRRNNRPASRFPDIQVQLADDAFSENRALLLGGNGGIAQRRGSSSAELNDQVSMYWNDNRHLTKLTLDARGSRESDVPEVGINGAYLFQSVSDFAADRASSYYWTSEAAAAAVRQNHYSLALGDEWDVLSSLHLQYGLRGDADAISPIGGEIGEPWALRSSTWSPRAGFSWLPGRVDPSAIVGPRGILVRGGVGRFVGTVPATPALRVAGASTPNAATQLVCVGSQVPPPDWSMLMAGSSPPRACSSAGSGEQLLPPPESRRFADGFAPPSAWRGSIGGSVPLGVRVDLEATYSVSANQMTSRDVNLAGTAAFPLTAEADRPVLVAPEAIDPVSGLAQPGAGRRDSTRGPELELRSDAHARARQFMITLSPEHPGRFGWSLMYSYEHATDQQPAVAYIPTGAPASVGYTDAWARSANEMRHQVMLYGGVELPGDATLSVFYSGRSGIPYSPTVAGDIDGDGTANDRAFVFAPSAGADAGVRSPMGSLLAVAPRGARRCLIGQVGRIAERNSCLGPWMGDATVELVLRGSSIRLSHVTWVRVQLVNLMAGADMMIHGAARAHGWGGGGFPDPVLLRPTGFDKRSGAYEYQVNSHFGRPVTAASGSLSPFTLAITLQGRFNPSPDERRLRDLLRHAPADGDKFATRLALEFGHAGLNPAAKLVSARSVGLSDSTIARLSRLAAEVRRRSDSLWASVATRFVPPQHPGEGAAAVGDILTPDTRARTADLLGGIREARDTEFRILLASTESIESILTPAEGRRLPALLRLAIDRKTIESQRRLAERSGDGG